MLSLLLTPPTPLAFCLLPCCVCWDGARRDDVGRWVAAAERVAGTDWLEVVCDDGKRYYFHSQSQETSWHVPPEVAAKQALRLDPAKARMLERARAMGAQLAPEYRTSSTLLLGGLMLGWGWG